MKGAAVGFANHGGDWNAIVLPDGRTNDNAIIVPTERREGGAKKYQMQQRDRGRGGAEPAGSGVIFLCCLYATLRVRREWGQWGRKAGLIGAAPSPGALALATLSR
jgi:hypothetical protein